MIYLFHGADLEKVRAKAFAWVAAARAKEPNLAYTRLTREEISESALQDAAQSGGLFVRRTLVLLDDPFANARTTEEEDSEASDSSASSILEDRLELLADSDNAIVILAPKLTAAKAKRVGAKAAKIYAIDLPATREFARGFNSGLVNALGARDGKRLWLEVVRALRAGDAPEMLHGLLHWKARDLLEKRSAAWTASEARGLSLTLIRLVQETRRTGADLGESLERFALSV